MKIKNQLLTSSFTLIAFVWFTSCDPDMCEVDLTKFPYSPTPYTVELPSHFPKLEIPADNPMTVEGIELGRFLFYDPILSADSTMSCGSCHMSTNGFTDGAKVSIGIDKIAGTRSSMSLINIGFVKSGLFWDGRVKTLEDQALLPVEDPIEMHHLWSKVEEELKNHPTYPKMFREAFGISNTSEITKKLAVKAIAQFERTIISKDAKFDKIEQGLAKYTDLELYGKSLFFDLDPDVPDAACWHCHNTPLATSDDFFNNGLTASNSLDGFPDKGRGLVTKSISDNGKFRAPTLRNIKYTAPYMHDGSMATLDDVITHYAFGGKKSPNSDPLVDTLQMDNYNRKALLAFINTLTDTVVIKNPKLQNPFK
jgi:cytochrome c peroxidase